MRVFVAGASGVIGRRLLPLLVQAGHSVVAMTRSAAKTAALRAAGAVPVVADALDEATVMTVVHSAEPEVVVHQLTAIPPRFNFRRFASSRRRTGFARRAPTTWRRRRGRSAPVGSWGRASLGGRTRATAAR
jgi:2-alkyl-3-oxoalkanoate reductase